MTRLMLSIIGQPARSICWLPTLTRLSVLAAVAFGMGVSMSTLPTVAELNDYSSSCAVAWDGGQRCGRIADAATNDATIVSEHLPWQPLCLFTRPVDPPSGGPGARAGHRLSAGLC